jgi:hypothetical protein
VGHRRAEQVGTYRSGPPSSICNSWRWAASPRVHPTGPVSFVAGCARWGPRVAERIQRWTAPPNWPAPPPGFVPPPGWEPDAAWGPPPPDWEPWAPETVSPKYEQVASELRLILDDPDTLLEGSPTRLSSNGKAFIVMYCIVGFAFVGLGLSELHGPYTLSNIADALGTIVVTLGLIWLLFYVVLRLQKRRNRRFLRPDPCWMSGIGYYVGPYEGHTALNGADEFFRRYSPFGKPVQGWLVVSSTGFEIVPGRRGSIAPLTIPLSDVTTVEVVPASRKPFIITSPGRAPQLGQIAITDHDGRRAIFAGTSAEPMVKLLEELGAQVVRSTS